MFECVGCVQMKDFAYSEEVDSFFTQSYVSTRCVFLIVSTSRWCLFLILEICTNGDPISLIN